jgi:hypothetical protein
MVSSEMDKGVSPTRLLSSQQANGSVVVVRGHRTTRNGNQMGCLPTSQRLAISPLSLAVQHCL